MCVGFVGGLEAMEWKLLPKNSNIMCNISTNGYFFLWFDFLLFFTIRSVPLTVHCGVCIFKRVDSFFLLSSTTVVVLITSLMCRNVSIILSSPWSQLHAEHKHTARWKAKREYICWEFESPNKQHDDNNNNNRNWNYTKAPTKWKGRNEWQGKKWIGAKWIIPKQNVGRVKEEATERKTSFSFAPANQSDHKFIVLNCFCILKYTFGPNFFPDGFVRSLHLQELPSGTFPHSQHNTCAIVLTNFRSSVHRCRFFFEQPRIKNTARRENKWQRSELWQEVKRAKSEIYFSFGPLYA